MKKRLIARLDIKNDFVIKGIHLEGLRKIGNPIELAKKYFNDGVDEILFLDAVASLYERNNLFNIIREACKEIFIPITIGGGLRSLKDIEFSLESGADKISINTQAIKTPNLIKDASRIFGSQCIVGSIEAKRKDSTWEVYFDNGREFTGMNAIDWAQRLQDYGIGELIVTSIDQEGTKKGFDIDLMKKITDSVNIPVIASGGGGNIKHISELFNKTDVSAVAIASMLHYNLSQISELKELTN